MSFQSLSYEMTTQLVAVLLVISLYASVAWASEDEKKLFTKLFENYDARVRPVEKNNDTLVVEVGVTLRKLVKLSPLTGTFEAMAWVLQKWHDYQLQWDPKEFGGINKLHVPQSDIFKTDLVLYNSAKAMYKEQRQQPNKAVVTNDGTTLVVDSVKLTADCPINETATEMTCTVILGSWVYDMSRIDLKVGSFEMDPEVISSPMWTVQGIKGKRVPKLYPKIGQRYVSINVDVKLTKNKDPEDIKESDKTLTDSATEL